MAKHRQEESAAASLNPRDMLAGGLKDDFRARVIDATYTRWDYDGNIDEPVLAAKLTLDELDADSGESLGEDPVIQHWSAGDLSAFVPSQDGKTPCEEDEDGPYALKVGKRAQLNNNTNFAHLITSAIEAGTAAKGKPFTEKNLTSSLECLIGLDSHWNRVPQKKRSGLVDEEEGGEKRRARDVLVVTEVYGYEEGETGSSAPSSKVKAKGKPNGAIAKGKGKARDEEEEEEEEDEEEESDKSPLDLKLEGVVTDALEAANGKLKKGKLAKLVLDALAKDKDKAKAVKRVSEDDFLAAGPWNYDEDTGLLTSSSDEEEEEEEEE